MAYDKFAAVDSSTLLFPPTVRANLAAVSPNYIINGGFEIAQRGTSLNSTFATKAYLLDRFWTVTGAGAANHTVSQVSSGITGISKAMRVQRTAGNTNTASAYTGQDIETVNSLPLAGQTITFSFYARAGANFSATSSTLYAYVRSGTGTDQTLASGPYTGNVDIGVPSFTLTTSWQRFTFTGSVGSTATQVGFMFDYRPTGTAGAADYYEVAGVQLEAGAVATPFRRNANSIQGELAACQRYYWRITSTAIGTRFAIGLQPSTTAGDSIVYLPTEMRTTPSVSYSSLWWTDGVVFNTAISSLAIGSTSTPKIVDLLAGFSASGAASRPGYLSATLSGSYLELSSEL